VSDYLYGRKYQILVTKTDGTALDVSNLRCTFHIEKTYHSVANYSEIVIYNMSSQTEGTIISEYDRVIVNAGYAGTTANDTPKQYGKIFDGNIIQCLRDKEDNNVDYKLTLWCGDGDNFLNSNFIKMTMNAGATHRQIVENIATVATVPTDIAKITPDLSTAALPRGKVFFGTPKKYLGEIAAGNNASFWIDNEAIHIEKLTDTAGTAIVVSPTSGLIGTPQMTQEGITIKMLLNANVGLMSMIQLDNSNIRQMKQQIGQIPIMLDQDGQYQAYKIVHEGDTRGNNWYTEVVGVSRYGKIPLMLAAGSQNGH
jgi:hypothetical protein